MCGSYKNGQGHMLEMDTFLWWCHMEMFSWFVAVVRGIHRSPMDSLREDPVMSSVFFDASLEQQLYKQ